MPCFKVTAELAAPVCGSFPFLDGVLCAAHVATLPSPIPASEWPGWHKLPTPIKAEQVGGVWVPRASSPIVRRLHEGVAHITRPPEFDLDAMRPTTARKINVTACEFKGVRIPQRVMAAERVVWFVESSVPREALLRWLMPIHALGKRIGIGYGRVSGWKVEACDDLCWFAPHEDGRVLMRPLPLCDDLPSDLIGYTRWFGCPAPPYWRDENAMEIVRPC